VEPRRWLGVVAIVGAVIEGVDVFRIDAPAVAGVFAVLFLVGAWLLRARRWPGVGLLGLLFLTELLFIPAYPRDNWADVLDQVLVGLVSLTAVVLVVLEVRHLRALPGRESA
jgi:hypothetical protein